jgi:hypothetical protein
MAVSFANPNGGRLDPFSRRRGMAFGKVMVNGVNPDAR